MLLCDLQRSYIRNSVVVLYIAFHLFPLGLDSDLPHAVEDQLIPKSQMPPSADASDLVQALFTPPLPHLSYVFGPFLVFTRTGWVIAKWPAASILSHASFSTGCILFHSSAIILAIEKLYQQTR
jgi:hypothetical protein